ncbi:hypothetical protein EV193_101604 [Herbihabitans rhizosphaerae]|uniref:Uncharacterized protein n=1 Tax=Herbihabitans rhizosphaerae TaxID=1872711 RepID=A0A4Q7L5W6_9PSEU|nr:hypothetical protein [Herbihabitans rhizosphaerae]RZS44727.1 hypothetical protein EV193_101604 [Herbihabitans rhizosphaerae]
MSAANYQLRGPGIEIDYRTDGDQLTVRGFGGGLPDDGATFHKVTPTATDVGDIVEVVLRRIDRGGNSYRLTLFLPQVSLPQGGDTHDVTGTAVFTHDISGRFAEPHGVLQTYDVRPLTGVMWN